jgi:hypothetical protein
VGNNPVAHIDPSGDYVCRGSKDDCAVIQQALRDVEKAAARYAQGSAGQNLLSRIVQFYGKDGDNNGVNVGFGDAGGNNSVTDIDGRVTNITFNLKSTDTTGENYGTTPRVETAAAAAHEGQHGIDGQFFGRARNRDEWRVTEHNAFTTQSYVNEAYNTTSPYGLWESGWKENSITNGLRESAENFNADWVVNGASASQ